MTELKEPAVDCRKCKWCDPVKPFLGAVTEWTCKKYQKKMCSDRIGVHFICYEYTEKVKK